MAKNTTNSFFIRTTTEGVIVNQTKSAVEIDLKPCSLPINVKCSQNKAHIQISGFDKFVDFYKHFSADILLMHTTEKNLDTIFCAFEQLILNYELLLKNIAPDHLKSQLDGVFATGTKFVIDKLKSHNSAKKRQKLLEKNECYVAPKDFGMALNWKSKKKCGNDLIDHELVQSTYQYVPMHGKIDSLFKNDYFHKSYFDFNENHKHNCTNDVYEGFCCGSIYKQHDIFEPTTIQLQLGIDEFEPCNALKTKVGLHKMYAVYFQIINVDPRIKSKLGNIHLVALAKSIDLKEGGADKIANKIVDELKLLETEGITIKGGRNLKAVLTNICSDNLGANSTFGFVECFNAGSLKFDS